MEREALMNIVPAIGAASLGIVIGWLVRYFIRRFDRFGPAVLCSVISIMLGGAVIKFLEADKSTWWFYHICLLLGFVIYQIIVAVYASGTAPTGVPRFSDRNDPRYMR